MNTSKIAAQLYTVRDFTKSAKDFEDTLKKLKGIGYDAIQVSAIGPIDYKEVKQMADSFDIKICVTHSPFDRMKNDLQNLIAEHKHWDCDYIGLGSMSGEFRKNYAEFIKILNPIAKEIAQSGLKFVYHNHRFEFEKLNGKTFFELIAENTNPNEVGFLVDTFWVQAGGASPSAFMSKYADRIDIVHLKDMQVMDDSITMAEVGEGNMDWASIMKACEDIEVKWYAVEQDTCYRNPFESLEISIENIKKW